MPSRSDLRRGAVLAGRTRTTRLLDMASTLVFSEC